ncbi:TnsA endonuclease N-terminal domain-containing protein [Psychrobacillus sp. FSL K6-4615]|uniref:TnsA endonuclease N-terminal domain-containing protein n=1 Tax=Psychrobacillus sp. FSL K6-4615 TaxID=2921551 RepID=UPI0030FB77C9
MLSEVEFLSWCERNNITKKTQEYINSNIRFAPPARSVGGGRKSTSGKYPSKKMGVTIQWESGKVEGPAVLMMENEEKVLEYYDQPNKINISYVNGSGRNRGVLYTPDFFVIRKNGAGWEEWKNEDDLLAISKRQPWKYIKDESGNWRCPPGEKFAKKLGLEFKVCTSNRINWNLHRNYVFLDDYLRKINNLEGNMDCLDEIKEVIFEEPGITLKNLIDKSTSHEFSADDVYIFVINNLIYVDLNEAALAEPDSVRVFLHEEHAKMFSNLISCNSDLFSPKKITIQVGTKFLWDNYIWKIINIGASSYSFISDGTYNEITRELFEKLLNEGKIIFETTDQVDNNSLIDLIVEASEEDYKEANYRLIHVKTYLEIGSKEYKKKKEPNLRRVRDWVGKFRKAEKLFGNGYVGLLPNHKAKGNSQNRFSIEVTSLMDHYIKEEYETLVQKNKTLVYGSFKNACEEKGYIAPSLATFCSYINNRPIEEQVRKRKGRRATYQKETFYWELERTTPRHGDFPFNICHLDHTELDIELLCSQTGKNLGRPHLSLMIDAFSRRVLAFYLSFESPSYRSCLMVFRDCVRRYNRLPQQIVVDNGREFHSIYFETLLSMFEKESKRRPPAQPRYGSILERLFGTTNTKFIHNLHGNTKIMKNVREVTKSINPKTQAEWSLASLSLALNEFFFELYDTIEHPALGQTPREAFQKGLFYSGERKEFYIPYDSLFEILTLPSTQIGEATIQQSGIKVNYIYYWNDEFKSLHVKKMKVKVRYDPFNIGIAYAYVNKRWIKCNSQYYSVFKNLTQKELNFITSEIKKSKKNHSKSYTINAQRIAKFIKELEGNNQFDLLKSKAAELKSANKWINKDSNIKSINSEVPKPNKVEESIENFNEDQILDVYGEF